MTTNIGDTLKSLRKKAGLTQVELAQKSNLSRTYLSDVENNRYNPSISFLRSVSDGLASSNEKEANDLYYELMGAAGYLDNRPPEEIISDLEKTMAKYKVEDYLVKGAIAQTKAELLEKFKKDFFNELKYTVGKEEIEKKTEEFTATLQKLALFNSYDLEEVFDKNSKTHYKNTELTNEQKEKIMNVIKAIL